MDTLDKLFIVCFYGVAFGLPFVLIGMICEWYFERRQK